MGEERRDSAEPAIEVVIAETGESFFNSPRHSILEAMRRLGRRGIPTGCRAGGCSVCKVEILSGAWTQVRPMSREYVDDEDLAAGRVLSCCVTPKEKLTLRVLGKMRKAILRPCAIENH